MASSQSKSESSRGRRPALLTLAGWGMVAISSFVVAFMALQFSEYKGDSRVAALPTENPPLYTGSIKANSKPEIGIMQRGAPSSSVTKTAELSTDVDLLRNELIALRRTVSVIRESRNQMAIRLSAVERRAQGFSTTIAKTKLGQKPVIPSDPTPIQANSEPRRNEIPPIPPIPMAAPASKALKTKQAMIKAAPKFVTPELKTTKAEKPEKPKKTVSKTPRKIKTDPITTASIGKKETKTKAVVEAERTNFGVDLGGYSSLATLNKGWSDMKQKQKQLLGNLAPRASLSDKNGRLEVRLVAGPFNNAAHAITLCAQLQAKGRRCQPTLFVGQPVVIR